MPCFFTGAAQTIHPFLPAFRMMFFHSLSRLKHPKNYVKSSLELCWIWIRKWHPFGHPEKMNSSERSTTHHFQIGITSTSTPIVIFEGTNKSQAIYVRTMPFQPLEFCHIPNESWVWKRKLYLWLQKKQQPLFGYLGSSKVPWVSVSTFFQILRNFHHLRTSKKKSMEKNTASWDPCRSQLSLLPWQRVMRPYGSLIAVGGFPEPKVPPSDRFGGFKWLFQGLKRPPFG